MTNRRMLSPVGLMSIYLPIFFKYTFNRHKAFYLKLVINIGTAIFLKNNNNNDLTT